MEIKAGPNILSRIKTGEVVSAEVGTTITVAARIAVDDTRVTRVGSPVMGRIASLTAREGEEVRRGQLLALLNSTGLSDAQLDFLKSISQKQVAQRAVDRAKLLLEADVIGSAELQRREAELAQASVELEAAGDRLLLLGMSPETVEELRRTRTMNSVSRVAASMDGTVMSRKVTLGQVVQPADTVYEIADLSEVWLVADVPQIGALANHAIHGKLSFVSSTVNPETRTVLVRMDLPNPKRRYKPAMLATMVLKEQVEQQRVVPVSAVVREESGECLFVDRGDGRFVLRPVKFGAEVGGRRVLLEGINPGEKIVVDGAFHLNNERRRRAVRGSGEGS
jgi:cobalt-zinc-cadmium efflux system membrane fusion protein